VGLNFIALAIPFFFLLIGVELLVARAQRRPRYRFADAVADLGCGIGQRVSLLFYEALLGGAYVLLYHRARLFDLSARPALAWVLAVLAVDFTYYWWHRASHRVNALWAAHIVHHQSEDYNLAVALRQSAVTPLTSLPFHLPLALVGIPPAIWFAAEALNTLYQFWIHTETVGRLGPLELVLNTPSHHRVHHGRNPQYLDRNYGGMLIVWDRLFGTFAAEREPVAYGITKPLASFNPLWAQVHHFGELARRARASTTARGWLHVWLDPPDRNGTPEPAQADAAGAWAPGPKYGVPVAARLRAYVTANFALAVAATFSLMMWKRAIPGGWLVVAAALVLLTTLTMGGLMEKKAWARPLEAARLGCAAIAVPVLLLVSR
jgi:sterol desaturase/sphingolipid hydroxylase (fatty acid hydroxylase superfamily)